ATLITEITRIRLRSIFLRIRVCKDCNVPLFSELSELFQRADFISSARRYNHRFAFSAMGVEYEEGFIEQLSPRSHESQNAALVLDCRVESDEIPALLQYPLLFPKETPQWHPDLYPVRNISNKISEIDHYKLSVLNESCFGILGRIATRDTLEDGIIATEGEMAGSLSTDIASKVFKELQQKKPVAARNRTRDLSDSGRPDEPKGYNDKLFS
ncbi:hypothetical protein BB560_007300, partial [Smittium megazygosporum]